MTLSAIIIEDESKSALLLKNLLTEYCPAVRIAGCAEDFGEGHRLIQKYGPSLVFLDIETPEGTAFDFLKEFDTFPFKIIFTTAYDHYALKAIKYGAVDYLLKPIQPGELVEAVNKALKNPEDLSTDKIKDLFRQFNSRDSISKLAIPTTGGITFVD